MEKKPIILTIAQEECINYPDSKDLLVQGIAGSGKSLVIVRRAIKIAKKYKHESPRIIIITYTNSLVDFSKESIDKLLESMPDYKDIKDCITVSTFDKFISPAVKKYLGTWIKYRDDAMISKIYDEIINEQFSNIDNRFLKPDKKTFMLDEFKWLLQRSSDIKNKDDYLKCRRYGRGVAVRPLAKDREIIYDVYKSLKNVIKLRLPQNKEFLYMELSMKVKQIAEHDKYDYVLVDECQDLGLTQLKIAKGLTSKAMTLCGDFAQKLWSNGFSWSEVGINIRGNGSKKLKGTYRNTKQILLLANSLLKHNEAKKANPEEYTDSDEIPTREGAKPILYIKANQTGEENEIINIVHKLISDYPEATIGILMRSNADRAAKLLNNCHIEYEVISSSGDYSVLEPGVKVVTMHSSKGLEFDFVIIPYLDTGIMPILPKNIDDDLERDLMDRERNILYVAMTRARHGLYMICQYSGTIMPSVLIDELDDNFYEKR